MRRRWEGWCPTCLGCGLDDGTSACSVSPAEGAILAARSAGYLDVDLEVVARSVGRAIDDYAAYVRAIAAWLSGQAVDSDTPG